MEDFLCAWKMYHHSKRNFSAIPTKVLTQFFTEFGENTFKFLMNESTE